MLNMTEPARRRSATRIVAGIGVLILVVYAGARGVASLIVGPIDLRDLHSSLREDRMTTFEEILVTGIDPDRVYWWDETCRITLMQRAVTNEKWEAAITLLQYGAKPNQEFVYPGSSVRGVTPLHKSVNGDLRFFRLLLEYGADVNAKDNYGTTPLHIAAESGDLDTILLLVEHGAALDSESKGRLVGLPVEVAVARGRDEVAAYLIEKSRQLILQTDRSAPLAKVALSMFQVKSLLTLIDLDPSVRHLAVESERKLLRIAIERNDFDSVRQCLGLGLDPNDGFEIYPTAMHLAAIENADRAISALVEGGGRVDARGRAAQTPLHYALTRGNLECAKALLELGADPQVPDVGGKTPLDLAKKLVTLGQPRSVNQKREILQLMSQNLDHEGEQSPG